MYHPCYNPVWNALRLSRNSTKSPLSVPGLLLILLCVLLVLAASYLAAFRYFQGQEITRAQGRLSLYHSTLSTELERFQHIPFILARDANVIAGAAGQVQDSLNFRLEAFADQAQLETIYLMNLQGLTIASSNWNDQPTLLGENYSFRPYFQQALAGQRGELFAIGATTNRPGYFIAEPVRAVSGDIIAVIAIKLSLANLTRAWAGGGETVFVSNADGIVVLATEPDWRYRSLFEVSDARHVSIAASRQFGNEPLNLLDWAPGGDHMVRADGGEYLHVATDLPRAAWTLHYLADAGRLNARALVLTGILAAGLLLLVAIAVYLRSQRIRTALAASQADRRALRQLNTDLEREVDDRRRAEIRLTKAQADLASASRLAALGQLSASVTHELGQPIAAMRNYLTAAELTQSSDPGGVLHRLGRIANRMENITKQLKFFASPGDTSMQEVDLRDLVDGAQILLEPDFSSKGVRFDISLPNTPVLIRGNRLRLEQVLVNLLRNAADATTDATADADQPTISVTISSTPQRAQILVDDNGHGLNGQSVETLLEPFHTTRASGMGMGLGLAISASIIKEHSGSLTAKDRRGGGTRFTVEFPHAPQDQVE